MFRLDSAHTIKTIVNTFGCEIPTTIHHSVLSILNEHTLKVRCQKGYEFGGSNNFSRSSSRFKKKIRFIKCRNSTIVNNVLPKCIRIGKSVDQDLVKHQRVKNVHAAKNRHTKMVKEQHIERPGYKHNKNAKHTKGLELV